MKTVGTNGGPLIAIPRSEIMNWAGIEKARFIGNHTTFSSDYEGACQLTNGLNFAPCDAATIRGPYAEAVIFTMPLETAIISVNFGIVYLVQVEYCEETWSFGQIDENVIKSVIFDPQPSAVFTSTQQSYIVFDSSLSGEEIENEFIEFDLDAGSYRCDVVCFSPDKLTGLYVIKISPMVL